MLQQPALPRNSRILLNEVYFWTDTVKDWKKLLLLEKYKRIILRIILVENEDYREKRFYCYLQESSILNFLIRNMYYHYANRKAGC